MFLTTFWKEPICTHYCESCEIKFWEDVKLFSRLYKALNFRSSILKSWTRNECFDEYLQRLLQRDFISFILESSTLLSGCLLMNLTVILAFSEIKKNDSVFVSWYILRSFQNVMSVLLSMIKSCLWDVWFCYSYKIGQEVLVDDTLRSFSMSWCSEIWKK